MLIIPKGPYVSFDHFSAAASADEIVDFARAIAAVPKMGWICQAAVVFGDLQCWCRRQEVPHLHLHILGGRGLADAVSRLLNIFCLSRFGQL